MKSKTKIIKELGESFKDFKNKETKLTDLYELSYFCYMVGRNDALQELQMIIYPEVSFTPEWKEGRRFERERIIKISKNTPNLEKNYNILMDAVCTKGEQDETS